ncbi:FUSC family protein [Falsibacillus pallidus]|uniref:FUSC family protein n=1 Tax=Falsibacillus pallidus TaxID=493781 RepID=UPI003D953B93
MNYYPSIRHWLTRLSASDPGLLRLKQASKVIFSVISSVVTTLLLLKLAGSPLFTAAILSGVIGMMGILVVMGDTDKEKKVTTLLLALSSAVSVTLGTFLPRWNHAADGALLLIIFLAFYLQKYGMRYFSICMVGFMSVYFSSLLKLQFTQAPWFYAAIAVGISYAFLWNFYLMKDKPEKVLKRSMMSFHKQTNLTLAIVKESILDPNKSKARLRSLRKNATKLNEYARVISDQLGSTDPGDIWPGIKPNQLRLYVFDTEMLIETFVSASVQLKLLHALEHKEVRETLSNVAKALIDAEVLRDEYDPKQLQVAEKTVQSLRSQLNEYNSEQMDSSKWLYLVRRIESIANHVIDGAYILQKAQEDYVKFGAKDESKPKEDETTDDENGSNVEEDKGLKLSTKKAFQAVIAGGLSILLGYLLSPTHQYWILLTAYIVLLGTESVGSTYVKAFQRTAGTLIGAVLGFFLAELVSGTGIFEVICLFFCVFMAFYLFQVSYTIMSFWITMMLALMYDLLLGGITEKLLQDRFVDTLIGAGIALLVSSFLFPLKTRDKINESIIEFFEELETYLTGFLESFAGKNKTINLADAAFNLDQKLNQIRTHAKPFEKIPGKFQNTGIERWMTILVAINYYAKHLVASTSRKSQYEQENELVEMIEHISECLKDNSQTMRDLLKGTRNLSVWDLHEERKFIEKYPDRNKGKVLNHALLIHNLYYVWKINQSILSLATELGASRKLASTQKKSQGMAE